MGLVRPVPLPVGLQRRVGAEGRGRRPDEAGAVGATLHSKQTAALWGLQLRKPSEDFLWLVDSGFVSLPKGTVLHSYRGREGSGALL